MRSIDCDGNKEKIAVHNWLPSIVSSCHMVDVK